MRRAGAVTPFGLQGELRAAALREASRSGFGALPRPKLGGSGLRFAKWDRAGQGEFWKQGVQRADTLEGKTIISQRVMKIKRR